MAATYTDNGTNTPNGSHLEFTYAFPVLQTEDVKVALNGTPQATTKYTVSLSPAKITFNNSDVDSTVQESTGAPKTGVDVRVYRETTVGDTNGNEKPKAVFASGSSIRATDLNNNQEQALFAIHELQEQGLDSEINLADDVKIKLGDAVDDNAEIWYTGNTFHIDSDKGIILETGNASFTVTHNGALKLGYSFLGGLIDDDWLPYQDDTHNLGSSSLQWKNIYIDGTAYLDTVDIDAGAIDGTTIGSSSASTGAFTTVSATDLTATGNVDLGNATSDTITATGRFDSDLVPSTDGARDLGASGLEWKDLYIDGTANIDSLVADTADINGGTIDGATIGVNSASTGAFTTVSATDLTATGNIILGNAATDSITPTGRFDAHIIPLTDGSIDLGASGVEFKDLYIDGIAYVDEIRLDDDQKIKFGTGVDSEIYHSGTVLNLYSNNDLVIDADDRLDIKSDGTQDYYIGSTIRFSLNNSLNYILANWPLLPGVDDTYDLGSSSLKWKDIYIDGTASIDDITGDAVVTTGTSSSDTKVYSAKRTEALFWRQDSTETLASGVTWASNDTTVASTGAIDARIRSLVTDVGGFRPIASEAAFPTTNPDPDDNAGTIVSITALSADRTASGTTLTAGCQTTGGTQVTITGCPNNQVFKSGYGLLVETTSTLNTYTFVRYLADTSSVATVAANSTDIDTCAANISAITGASTQATNAATSATNAASSATAAASSATSAASSATTATTQASTATTQATTATTKASEAATSATTASTQATNAATSATNAASSATTASTQATNAASSATSAASSATTATTQASTATTQASTATTQASNASTSATNAAASATTASTQATNAATSATNAASSATTATTKATAAASSATSAEAYRDEAQAILTQVDSIAYNVNSNQDWGAITDTGSAAVFANETSNILLSMSEGSATYDYASIT